MARISCGWAPFTEVRSLSASACLISTGSGDGGGGSRLAKPTLLNAHAALTSRPDLVRITDEDNSAGRNTNLNIWVYMCVYVCVLPIMARGAHDENQPVPLVAEAVRALSPYRAICRRLFRLTEYPLQRMQNLSATSIFFCDNSWAWNL